MIDDDAVCYRHGQKAASVACQRCDRPICTQCMTTASVGFHCPACVQTGAQQVFDLSTMRKRARSSPLVTALVVVNVIVFLLQGVAVNGRSVENWGILAGPLVASGDWWRVVTSGFLHADTMHLGSNMIGLYIFGNVVAPAIGNQRLALVYAGGLLGGTAAVLTFNWNVLALGASGAVLGLVGGIVALSVAQGQSLRITGLMPLIVISLVIPLVSNVSFWGHLGGVAGGFAVGWLLIGLPVRFGASDQMAKGVATLAVVLLGAFGLYVGSNPF